MMESARQVQIIRVQIGEGGYRCPFESLSNGVGGAFIFLARPIMEVPLVLPDNFQSVVIGSTIHHDVLQVWITLEEYRPYRFFKKCCLVVRRRDDGDRQ